MTSSDILGALASYTSTVPEVVVVDPSAQGRGTGIAPYQPQNTSKSEIFLGSLSQRGFDVAPVEGILRDRRSQLILAGAGSGKTTTMLFKVMYDFLTGDLLRTVEVNNNPVRVMDKVWVCTFLKSGAQELETRLYKWQRELKTYNMAQGIVFGTLHSEFYQVLKAMGINKDVVNFKEETSILSNAISLLKITNNGARPTFEHIRDLGAALTYTRNRLPGDSERYTPQIYRDLNIPDVLVDSLISTCRDKRVAMDKIDFEDLQDILYRKLFIEKDERVIKFIGDRYNHIYIDEFQDTSQIQYAILKAYIAGSKKVVAIGDDDQTVYSWRGSDHTIITRKFEEDFAPNVHKLGVNYRCPSTILNAILPSIEKNTERHPKELKSSKEGGILRVGYFGSYGGMVKSLTESVQEDLDGGLSVAILCRVNSDGLVPAIAMDRMGLKDFSLTGSQMTFDGSIGRAALGIVKLFTEKSTDSVKKALESLVYRDKMWEVTSLIKACKADKISFWKMEDEDLLYSCESIGKTLVTWKRSRAELGDMETLKHVLAYYATQVYQKDTQYNSVMRTTLQSLALLIDDGFDSAHEFLDDVDDLDRRLNARVKAKGSRVVISTVHDFKGKEADSVYIWNDSKDVFPHKSSQETLNEIEEERRLHYIACTRATQKSSIFSLQGKVGEFVQEMDLSQAERIEVGISGALKKKPAVADAGIPESWKGSIAEEVDSPVPDSEPNFEE